MYICSPISSKAICAWLRRVIVGVLLSAFGFALLAPSPALAAFTRPFLCQIPSSSFSGFGPEGVAVDAADHLWVSEPVPGKVEPGKLGHGKLYEFNPAYSSCGGLASSLEIEGFDFPVRLAIESSTNHFYIVGQQQGGGAGYVEVFDNTGKLVERWSHQFEEGYVAVDPAGSVYVAHRQDGKEPLGDGSSAGIGKFDTKGKPAEFGGVPECEKTKCGYLKGNEITGTTTKAPFELWPESIAVDSQGNIYAVNQGEGNGEEAAVDEYSPNGIFRHAFTGKETPGLGESRHGGGWGGSLLGIAVDPLSGHLLVSVSGHELRTENKGAVDEFDPTTGEFLNQISQTSAESSLHSAEKVTVDSHGYAYVVDGLSKAIDVYGPGHFLPSFKLAEATERKPMSAVLNGAVDSEGLSLNDCHFEYVSEEAFEKEGFSKPSTSDCVPMGSQIPVDRTFHAVHAEIGGLVSGATYRYRLVATTEGVLGGSADSEPLAFTAPHAPRVDSASPANISSTFADLRAQINPLGAETTYHFEYDTSAYTDREPHGVSVPVPDVDIGPGGPTGGADVSVLRQIGGLAPGTTYHFRVVAKNEVGITYEAGGEQPEGTFTTLPTVVPGLHDNRADELLTPPNKGSATDMFGTPKLNGEYRSTDRGYSSESGDGFLLETSAAFGPFPVSVENAYVFKRDAHTSHWETLAPAPRSLGVQSVADFLFNPSGFSQVGFSDTVGSSASGGGTQRQNLVGPLGGPYTILHRDAPAHREGANVESTKIVGASHDLGRVVLASTVEHRGYPLCPVAEQQDLGSLVLCEWTGGYETVNGELQPELNLVNSNSEGELLNPCGATLGAGILEGSARNAVSYDGSRTFFTAPNPLKEANNTSPGCWRPAIEPCLKTEKEVDPPQLYMRSGSETVKISEPEEGVKPVELHPAVYVGASEDGSKVFFVTETELTKDAVGIHEPCVHDPELYQCEIVVEISGTQKCKLTRISVGESGSSGAHVFTVPAVATQGSAVYFTAFGALVPGAPTLKVLEQEEGEEGPVNLYRYDTSTRMTTFVATVSTRDYPNNVTIRLPLGEVGLVSSANWYTTPDGRYLLFASTLGLTGYDTAGNCLLPTISGGSNGHCEELYRYNSAGGNLVCVSCNPSGAPPTSNALFTRSAPSGLSASPPRAMSDDGAYVFFDTAEALVPQDGNGTLDVYEWHDGGIALISSGKDFAPSFFLGASPDGANAFFGTHARLVPQDTDASGDLYDARICTPADPCIKPPPGGTGQCEGDACQNPAPAPIDATPVSLTFSGAGNVFSRSGSVVKPRSLTPAQQLAKALRACKRKPARKRAACEAQARKRYGTKSKFGRRAGRSTAGRRRASASRGAGR
jgi:hypothetical protein